MLCRALLDKVLGTSRGLRVSHLRYYYVKGRTRAATKQELEGLVIVEGRDGSGMMRVTQHARATYSSQQVGYALHSSESSSTIHAPARSRLLWPRG